MTKQPDTAEDDALWAEITKDIRKMPNSELPPSKPVILPEIRPTVNLAAAYRGEKLDDLKTGNTDDMDGSLAKRFKRCDIPVEATLDLHGFREEEARAAVFNFIQKRLSHRQTLRHYHHRQRAVPPGRRGYVHGKGQTERKRPALAEQPRTSPADTVIHPSVSQAWRQRCSLYYAAPQALNFRFSLDKI